MAEKAGISVEELNDLTSFDGKFAALSAIAVLLNIIRMAPEALRGKVLGECLDFLLVNVELNEESMKQVLYNCLMQIGSETGKIEVRDHSE